MKSEFRVSEVGSGCPHLGSQERKENRESGSLKGTCGESLAPKASFFWFSGWPCELHGDINSA